VRINRGVLVVVSLILLVLALGSPCQATEESGSEKTASNDTGKAASGDTGGKSPLATGLTALAAALAVGLCALATGIAQSRIGAAGCGAIAEKPEVSGTVIVLVAIPETMVILGFVIGVVLLFTQ
jgi:V/A-type H+-transporting ATPase subunit K